MHALGFQHEHQRPDRDDYIEVLTENVRFDYRFEFDIIYNDWSPFNKGKLFENSNLSITEVVPQLSDDRTPILSCLICSNSSNFASK